MVDGADGEVAALVGGFVGEVSAFFLASGVPGAFNGVDLVVAAVLTNVIAHVIKDVELGLSGEEGGVGDAGLRQVLLCFVCHLARVTAVDFTVTRVVDVKEHDQRLLITEGVQVGGRYIRNELQV